MQVPLCVQLESISHEFGSFFFCDTWDIVTFDFQLKMRVEPKVRAGIPKNWNVMRYI